MLPSTYEADFADEQLLQTALTFSGTGNDASQPAYVRFVRGVARVLMARVDQAGSLGSEPAVFLLHPTLPPVIEKGQARRHRMIDNGRTPLAGRLWLVGPVVASGWSAPLSFDQDDDIFKQVADDYELGAVPAVIHDPRTSPGELRFFQRGLDEPDDRVIVPLPGAPVTLEDVTKVIDRVHATKLVTPDAQSETAKLWEKPTKYFPIERAELTVQMYLETALFVAFPHCAIRREQPQISGRLDLEIEGADPFDPQKFVRYVLLELKVLRSFGSGGIPVTRNQVDKWIEEGVDQASEYALERGARATALCCFDMRRENAGEACFAHVIDKARQLGVGLRVWYLFASAKAYRADRAGTGGEGASTR